MRVPLLCLCLVPTAFLSAQQLTANDIMARVAANQDRAQSARTHYVYTQHAHMLSRKGKTIRCEETTDYRVTPNATGSERQLLALDGLLLQKGKYVRYHQLAQHSTQANDPPQDKHHEGPTDVRAVDEDDRLDRDLVENMRDNLTNNDSSDARDGMSADLFPLTSKHQAHTAFRLLGRGSMNGRDCYHIAFSPDDKDDYGWKGDAWIDATAFEPVVVRTTMARKIPFAVRTLMGTDVPGLGFTITYAPQPADAPDALWFPSTFGTEFKLRVLFFLSRQLVLDVQNRDFERTHVSSTILPF